MLDLKEKLAGLDDKVGKTLDDRMLKVLGVSLTPLAETVAEKMVTLEARVDKLVALEQSVGHEISMGETSCCLYRYWNRTFVSAVLLCIVIATRLFNMAVTASALYILACACFLCAIVYMLMHDRLERMNLSGLCSPVSNLFFRMVRTCGRACSHTDFKQRQIIW